MDCTFRCFARLSLSGLMAAVPVAATAEDYATWHPWQLDSALVLWAIEKASGHSVRIESLPRDTDTTSRPGAIWIDTPDAIYRRTGQRTAFEEAVRKLDLKHPCVERLREAVRVVEFAGWRKPDYPNIETFEMRVLNAVPKAPAKGGMEPALAVINNYCGEAK